MADQTQADTSKPSKKTAPPPAPTQAEPAKKAPAYTGNLRETQFSVREYTMTLPEGHTLEDIMRPEYWAHAARKLDAPNGKDRQGDILICKEAHGAWEAKLRVVAKGDSWAKMALLSVAKHRADGQDPEPISAIYDVLFVPPGHWNVMNKRANKVEAGPFTDKAMAYAERDKLIAKLTQ